MFVLKQNGSAVGNQGFCFTNQAPVQSDRCTRVLAAWIKGGEVREIRTLFNISRGCRSYPSRQRLV